VSIAYLKLICAYDSIATADTLQGLFLKMSSDSGISTLRSAGASPPSGPRHAKLDGDEPGPESLSRSLGHGQWRRRPQLARWNWRSRGRGILIRDLLAKLTRKRPIRAVTAQHLEEIYRG
jgi:hypothetical protein